MLPSPALLEVDAAVSLLRDSDGNVRAAMICWGIVLSAFIVFRIPREVLLWCLIVAGATVGLAATAIDLVPEQAVASADASAVTAPRGQAVSPLRGPPAQPAERVRLR
jgi:hypothetical protein